MNTVTEAFIHKFKAGGLVDLKVKHALRVKFGRNLGAKNPAKNSCPNPAQDREKGDTIDVFDRKAPLILWNLLKRKRFS
jgi:hypothetical protein